MPELPEAETVRSQLAPKLFQRRIIHSWARVARITIPSIREFAEHTHDQRIVDAKRRGKQIYFPLENGWNLLVHLGMTGRLHVEKVESRDPFEPALLPRHVHAVLQLDNATRLIFTDPRMFGKIGVARELPFLQKMGPEPLDEDFDHNALVQKLKARKTKIKNALLDQTLVAGLGNIYADEVCFLAGVHPEQRACDVPTIKLRKIVSEMKPVLERAIAGRGATLKDGGYKDTNNQFGEFVPEIYGRTNQPCKNCETPIRRGVLGAGKTSRSHHFCPKCQKLRATKLP